MRETLGQAIERVKAAADLKEVALGLGMEPRGKSTYVCPICGSGTKAKHSAALSVSGNRWKCFSCGHGGDALDLAGAVLGEQDKREQLEAVARIVGVDGLRDSLTAENGQTRPDTHAAAKQGRRTDESAPRAFGWDEPVTIPGHEPIAAEPPKDYSEGRERHAQYIRECQERITDPRAVAYLEARGITLEQAQAWGLGYDPQAGGAKDESGAWCERGRVIIPWPGTPWYHVDRSTDPRAKDGKYHKPKSDEVGPQPIWNPQALAEPLFYVVEGALDALAVESAGYPAVALCSTSHADLVALMAAKHGTTGCACLMLDADEPGRRAQADMAAALKAAGVTVYEVPTDELGAKDADELRARDAEALRAFLTAQAEAARTGIEEGRERAYNEALTAARVLNPLDVVQDVYDLTNAREPVPFGFPALEAALSGGLPSFGLVVLGAVSSVGKTTFAVQVADNLARAGRPVLFVTCEQTAEELAAKSLSRIMGTMAYEGGGSVTASAQHILSRKARASWGVEKLQALAMACQTYADEIAPRLRYMEALEPPTVGQIAAVAERMAAHDGQPPVVFVDYLQLLASYDERASDKQATDRNVSDLRRMANGLRTPVVAISSLNRASYSLGVTMESMKESGSIEFSADLLLGLQPEGMSADVDKVAESKQKGEGRRIMDRFKRQRPRQCEVVVLKNRGGAMPDYNPKLEYNPLTNTFTEPRA